ncbi:MAG: bifunctional DNA-formamidopyrimidine glycosylase/DNA-(apurinic or apyrimidinic site) lyase [Roseiflexaceae bacterium]
MPELPEVQHATDSLAAQILGHRIARVIKLDWPRMVETPDPAQFVELLVGRRFEGARRRAKWIMLELDQGWTLALHLRMSGHITVEPPGSEPSQYVHFAFELDDRRVVLFHDTRKFGRARLLDAFGLAELEAAHGVEPLDPAFTPAQLAQILRARARQLKPLLLDQHVVAGIGNIYADESLWRARLHPLRLSDTLSDEEISALHAAIRASLEAGIRNGGSTLRDYRNAYGKAGTNQQHFYAYDRQDRPCERCGTAIVKTFIGQRGTHYCPVCQPDPASVTARPCKQKPPQ